MDARTISLSDLGLGAEDWEAFQRRVMNVTMIVPPTSLAGVGSLTESVVGRINQSLLGSAAFQDQLRSVFTIQDRLAEAMRPTLAMNQHLAEALKPAFDVQERLAEALKPAFDVQERLAESLKGFDVQGRLAESLKGFDVQGRLAESFRSQTAFEQLQSETVEQLTIFAGEPTLLEELVTAVQPDGHVVDSPTFDQKTWVRAVVVVGVVVSLLANLDDAARTLRSGADAAADVIPVLVRYTLALLELIADHLPVVLAVN